MCKIQLQFENFTKGTMESHRESCEQGAGFGFLREKQFTAVRALKHEDALKEYEKAKTNSPFSLFHSRLASHGTICDANTQPFTDGKILFCHNGTEPGLQLCYLCAAMGLDFTAQDSDSLLLFRMLSRMKPENAVELLKKIDDNFIYGHLESQRLYLIGKFDFLIKKDRLKWAKNVWGKDRVCISMTFGGRVMTFQTLEKYTPVVRHYNGGNYGKYRSQYGVDDYSDEWWNDQRRVITADTPPATTGEIDKKDDKKKEETDSEAKSRLAGLTEDDLIILENAMTPNERSIYENLCYNDQCRFLAWMEAGKVGSFTDY